MSSGSQLSSDSSWKRKKRSGVWNLYSPNLSWIYKKIKVFIYLFILYIVTKAHSYFIKIFHKMWNMYFQWKKIRTWVDLRQRVSQCDLYLLPETLWVETVIFYVLKWKIHSIIWYIVSPSGSMSPWKICDAKRLLEVHVCLSPHGVAIHLQLLSESPHLFQD